MADAHRKVGRLDDPVWDEVAPAPSPPLAAQPVHGKRPWWRWILYAAAVLLAGLLPMVVGIILWANPTYRRVGRITVYLSSATIVLIALAFLVGSFID